MIGRFPDQRIGYRCEGFIKRRWDYFDDPEENMGNFAEGG
jgi:hypothetical protein